MKLLVKKYNESKDDDVLQDGVVVSFDELAKAAKIPVDKLPDEVFKDLDAERNQFDEEKRDYEPLVASCLAMKKIVNLELSLTTACLNFKIISKKIDDQRFFNEDHRSFIFH